MADADKKRCFSFSSGRADASAASLDLIGSKGAQLAEMCRMKLPVPAGFTLPTWHCNSYWSSGGKLADDTRRAIDEGLETLAAAVSDRAFGDLKNPMLLSVRSGAAISMPGMMDTVLNIGLTHDSIAGLANRGGGECFALDCYRRLLQMFAEVVCDIPAETMEAPLERQKQQRGTDKDGDLTPDDLRNVIDAYETLIEERSGAPFPSDPYVQLSAAVTAVFRSWNTPRAIKYRQIHDISDDLGTGVTVQMMVFGNRGEVCGSGVTFTRSPSTGENAPYGEWLMGAQGEDVVAGVRTPGSISSPTKDSSPTTGADHPTLQDAHPELYEQLISMMAKLERHYRDVQDIEFTIDSGKLYLLQTRCAKRTAASAVRVASEMCESGLIDRREALRRISPEQVSTLLHPRLDPTAGATAIAVGLPASPGAASGRISFCADEAVRLGDAGEDVILVRRQTSATDVHGFFAARGILTATGGMTSHAAVVARGLGRPCVAGCKELDVDENAGNIVVAPLLARQLGATDGSQGQSNVFANDVAVTIKAGDVVTIDGDTGEVFRGAVPTIPADLGGGLKAILGWADDVRELGVRANADTPEDAARAIDFGAEGLGLCRTEHMFFAPTPLSAMRRMILAADETARDRALNEIEPLQRADFEGIFAAMGERPVTIRLLDPPLHEFLPTSGEDVEQLAAELGCDAREIVHQAEALKEQNPMLGNRGCRLGIGHPHIVAMQTRAILDAALNVAARGLVPRVEIMVPLVMDARELETTRKLIVREAAAVFARRGEDIAFEIGTMIELPRAALLAGEIARHADFLSFGTNDLTQTALGLSRDDAGSFLQHYIDEGILDRDPFASIDIDGVGELVRMALQRARHAKPGITAGVCGEHGGDPRSIAFFRDLGLDYVSCSPFRIPVARLAAVR